MVEPRRVRDRALELHDEEGVLAEALAGTWGARPAADGDDGGAAGWPRLYLPFERLLDRSAAAVLSLSSLAEGPDAPAVAVRGFGPVAGDAERLGTQVGALVGEGYSVTLCVPSAGGAERLSGVLGDHGVVAPVSTAAAGGAGARVVVAPLSSGFILPGAKVAVLSESDVSGRRTAHRRARPRARPTDGFFDDLAPGSYVVHRQHGVARYAGTTTRAIGGTTRDYLVLEYRGSDRLYLPVDQIDAVTPYSGGESPTLSKMGGADWQRARARARAAAGEIAQELVALYRRRLAVTGHAFGPDSPWQAELESSFPFTETQDQLRAIADVKADMEQPRPMDRLVCGDVGFGKTEVAIRAVFKAVQDGKQAAVLVPTTLLASQHHQTFAERFAAVPGARRAVEPLPVDRPGEEGGDRPGRRLGRRGRRHPPAAGRRHRLQGPRAAGGRRGAALRGHPQRGGQADRRGHRRPHPHGQPDPADPGDGPDRDPRPLHGQHAAGRPAPDPDLCGRGRRAAVSEAIRRELLREGQVFYVHNRVADIDAVARRVGSLAPEARIAVAHGQMDEGTLEQVVLDFWERQYDVLVCTTIIESGIDMPSVNTLVVDRADLLGLGQLHQIRGRVGRSNQRAYAYLFHPADRVLTEQAYERLRTIGEHTELGSGFKIAMRDLEIRGAGNLLGADQSGHIAAVGYDLYVQLVAEAVAEARGEPRPQPPGVSLDVPGDAHLPAAYVAAEDARLEAYRRLAAAGVPGDVEDIAAEWLDRFGPLPGPAEGLLALARLRVACLRTGVTDVAVAPVRVGGARHPTARLSPLGLAASAQVRLRRLAPGATYREGLGQLVVPLTGTGRPAEELCALLDDLVPPEPAEGGPATNSEAPRAAGSMRRA